MNFRTDSRQFKRINRRELLKLSPVLALGAFAIPKLQKTLLKFRQNTRHVCIEGWDVIGRFGGARLADFLQMIGADPAARFITVQCADDYYESLDMATARHPQSLLCYEMYDQPLTREHGA